MARTEEYWQYEDGLIYLVRRTQLAQKVRLHYEVVCPHCEKQHNVFPYEAKEWLKTHFDACRGRPREGDLEVWDQWAIMKMLTGRFGYRRNRALAADFEARQRAMLDERRERYGQLSHDASGRLSEKNLDSHEMGPQRASEGVLSEVNAYARRLAAVEDALTRLNEQTYGVCADCQIDIEPERLEAIPEAVLCVVCADKLQLA